MVESRLTNDCEEARALDEAMDLEEESATKTGGPTPAGPWSEARSLRPGWAHEIWAGQDGHPYTSYVSQGAIEIQRLTWDDHTYPPNPVIGYSD